MKLRIPFDELRNAIEQTSHEHHYLIDRKNHEIILISELEDDYEKKLEKVKGNDFIAIKPRMPGDDLMIMESFAYRLQEDNFELAERFHTILEQKKPFKNFKELINQHPELREKWFVYNNKEMINKAMNWLCNNEIELEDNSFMPKIEIKELKVGEVELPEEFAGFGPAACMNCNNKDGFKTRYFELSTPAENMLIEREIKKIMKKKFRIEKYGHICGGEKEILTSSKCSKCKSTDIFEDF